MSNAGAAGSTEQAIGQWLDESLNSLTDFMTEVTAGKDGQTDIAVGGPKTETISGQSLSKEDSAAIIKAAQRAGGGAGLYTKTHKGDWVGTHTMEGMLVTAKANQELTQGTNLLTKTIEQKAKVQKKGEQASKTMSQYA
ncbi:MAG: hypothetical protein HQ564_06700 [Candidatus Saganbacteria bacterium]|nr:hypothetical protein [Candidatus Saganbacteria bacterium]